MKAFDVCKKGAYYTKFIICLKVAGSLSGLRNIQQTRNEFGDLRCGILHEVVLNRKANTRRLVVSKQQDKLEHSGTQN